MDFMAFHMGPPGGFRKLRHAVARDHDSVFHLYFGSQLVESIQQADFPAYSKSKSAAGAGTL
jgi:hypothetical protein